MKFSIHCEPKISWQPKRAGYFAEGLKKLGIPYVVTDRRQRIDGYTPLLLGTSCWRILEVKPYLLVDRCSFGDTEKFVSLVWNGHGRRGDHRTPGQVDASRWEAMGVELRPWRKHYLRVVLCGQTETYSPHYAALSQWYEQVEATHFRPHPADPYSNGRNLPILTNFDNAAAVTLNSSIGVQCVLDGVPTVTMDEGSMAWDVTGHSLEDIRRPDRLPWCHRLAWTQWSDDEIKEGTPWASLL